MGAAQAGVKNAEIQRDEALRHVATDDDRTRAQAAARQLDAAQANQAAVAAELGGVRRQLALLQALMARPGHAVSKEHLFEQVFPGAEDVQYEAIEVVAYRLRKKLAHSGVMLVTLRGLGYLLKTGA